MERAIIGAPAFRRRLRFVPLLVLLSVCQTAVYAQLSDEAVLEYAFWKVAGTARASIRSAGSFWLEGLRRSRLNV